MSGAPVEVKNFSRPADNNKSAILEHLQLLAVEPGRLLEVGSGSGQHAVFLGEHLPQLTWQPTEQVLACGALKENITEYAPSNVLPPIALEVGGEWPIETFEYVYSANVLHIMAASLTADFFRGAGQVLATGGRCFVYGPFKYDGAFTTDSNARFDLWLRDNHEHGGIRDIEAVTDAAGDAGLTLQHDFAMPANNQLLVFQRGE